MSLSPRSLLVPGLVASAFALPLPGQTLRIGDKAPALAGIHWIKGAPVSAFEPGKLYVVEFWATWCGPCKATIPHLTELAAKYKGRVQVCGISIKEKRKGPQDTTYLKGVETFVRDQGDRMAYTVGADGVEGRMAATWYEASSPQGIPTAFVVDGQGRIAWTGHPKDLERVLEASLAGTWDLPKAARDQGVARAQQKKDEPLLKAFFEALRKEDFATADRVGGELFPASRPAEASFGYVYYTALTHTDAARATAYAKRLAEGVYRGSAPGLAMLLDAMARNPKEDPAALLALAARAAQEVRAPGDPFFLAALGRVYARCGQPAEALRYDREALAAAEAQPAIDAAFKATLRARVEAAGK